jgi:ribonuclease HI
MDEKSHLSITIIWIPGHAEIEGNERADLEAKKAARNLTLSQPFHH